VRRVLPLATICAIGLSFAAAQAIVVPFAALFAQSLEASPLVLGIVLGIGFYVPLVLAMPIGRVADRVGTRWVIAAGSLALALSAVPLWITSTLPALALVVLLAHLGHLSLLIATQRAVADLNVAPETGYGTYSAFISLGQLIGPALMGLVIEAAGILSGLLAFQAIAAVGLVAGFAALAFLPRGDNPSPSTAAGSLLATLRSYPGTLVIVLSSGAVVMAMGAHMAFYPTYLATVGVGPFVIGLVLSLRALVAILVRPLLPWCVRVVGSRRSLYLAALLACAIGISLPLGLAPITLAVIGTTLLGVGSGLAQPMSMVFITAMAPRDVRGYLLGLRMAVNYAGLGSSTTLLGLLVAAIGYTGGFAAIGAIPAAITLAAYLDRQAFGNSKADVDEGRQGQPAGDQPLK